VNPDASVVLGALSILGTVEAVTLAATLYNARNVGTDEKAREWASEAEEQAQYAHRKVNHHLRDDHGQDVAVARPDGGEEP
jgi:hypothetical protein